MPVCAMPEAKTDDKDKIELQYPLRSIYFYLTEGCNLACRHCWIAPKFQSGEHIYSSLPLALFKSIIEQARPLGLSGVKLTGGEPLMHPQINEILDFVKENKLRLTVETNGVLCSLEAAKKMKECENPFVSVSLDGAAAATHEWVRGVEGCFDQAIQGAKNLIEAGFKPQIIMSLMKRNVNEVEALIQLAESLGAGSVKFNLIQPTARGEKMHETGEALTIKELVALGKWVEKDLSARYKIKLFYSHPSAFQPLGKIAKGGACGNCGIKSIIGVLADGSYALCGIGENVPELIFGKAERDKLIDIWENNAVLNQIKEGIPKRIIGICGNCVMKNSCLGSCVAQNYYRKKDLFAPFWFCEGAKKSGHFPASRMYSKI